MIEQLTFGPASLGQLAAPLAMSLPAVHQHLAVLEQAGLVTTEKQGRVRRCRIDTDGVALAESWLAERRLHWNRRLDRLDAHMRRHDHDPDT